MVVVENHVRNRRCQRESGRVGCRCRVVVRAIVGAVILLGLGPLGFVRPRLSWTRIRPIFAFGVSFQAVQLVNVVRDQCVNIVTAAVASFTVRLLVDGLEAVAGGGAIVTGHQRQSRPQSQVVADRQTRVEPGRCRREEADVPLKAVRSASTSSVPSRIPPASGL